MRDDPAVALRPVVSWPHVVRAGRSYLITVDLDTDPAAEWKHEEYPIGCVIGRTAWCTVESRGSSTLVVHRFGGTYGPVNFVVRVGQLTESLDPLRLTFITAGGLPFHTVELHVQPSREPTHPQKRPTCFVLMPHGPQKIKRTTDRGETEIDVDFDRVYEELYKKAAEAMGFDVVRSGATSEPGDPGSINQSTFTHIASDDLAIFDITSYNPNVMYGLGIRHALRQAATIVTSVARSQTFHTTFSPFVVQRVRIIEYPGAGGNFADARERIETMIRAATVSRRTDSPIYDIVREALGDTRPERITDHRAYRHRLSTDPRRQITIITGDILEWRGIDVWVNSENTNMQMARYFDNSLSATIRYAGAEKDEKTQRIIDDTIAEELKEMLDGDEWVEPGTVCVTGAGVLADSHGVKRIFHAATVYGTRGVGYRMIEGVEQCVTNALRRMERHRDDGLRTIVFPMMGTGVGGGDVQVIAPRLIRAAIAYFSVNPDSNVTEVYFSAWSHRDLYACLRALTSLPGVEAIPD